MTWQTDFDRIRIPMMLKGVEHVNNNVMIGPVYMCYSLKKKTAILF